jgi:hypothetical protein
MLALFRSFLDHLDAAWADGPRDRATLPATRDGKVNVRALAAAFRTWAGERPPGDAAVVVVPASAWQYVHNDPEWRDDVNALALAQGLKPVGSRTSPTDVELPDGVQARIARLAKEAKAQGEGHATSRALIARLERELVESEAEVRRWQARFRLLQETGAVLRTGEVEG